MSTINSPFDYISDFQLVTFGLNQTGYRRIKNEVSLTPYLKFNMLLVNVYKIYDDIFSWDFIKFQLMNQLFKFTLCLNPCNWRWHFLQHHLQNGRVLFLLLFEYSQLSVTRSIFCFKKKMWARCFWVCVVQFTFIAPKSAYSITWSVFLSTFFCTHSSCAPLLFVHIHWK